MIPSSTAQTLVSAASAGTIGETPSAAWFARGERIGYDPKERAIFRAQAAPLNVFLRQEGHSAHAVSFLPGFPDGSFGWAKVLMYLPGPAEMPKLFFDYIGMGDSDKPKDYVYSTAERADLVEAIWQDLSVQFTLVAAKRDQVGYPVPIVQQPLVSRAANWTSFLPRVGLDYQWTPTVMTYVSAAEGEKSGGYNGRASSPPEFTRFDPEKVWAYEVGLRSLWFDQRLRFNGTGYYSDYRGFQIQVNRSMTDPVTGLPVAFSYVGNMPKATIKGGEFGLTVVPVSSLLLSSGLGITDGKYVRISPGAPVTTSSQFVNAPKYTFTAGAEQAANLHHAGLLTARIDYIHKSRIQYDYGNSPLVSQAPYGLLNAKLSWQKPESRLSFFSFGTNLTAAHYAVGGLDDGPGGSIGEVIKLMGSPRELGLGGQFRF